MTSPEDTLCLVNGIPTPKSQLPEIDGKWLNVYEVVRAQQQVVLFARDHFERFCQSLKVAQRPFDTTYESWLGQLQHVLNANNLINNNIRTDRYYSPDRCMYEIVWPVASHYPTEAMRANGVATSLQFDERNNPNAKITDLRVRGKANATIAATGIFETLLVNHRHEITEGSRSNFFAIQHQKLVTAPDHMVLQGIMRKKVIETCQRTGLEIDFRPLGTDELTRIDGAFLTGTSPRVLAISAIDDVRLPPRHHIILQLGNAIEKLVQDYVKNA